MVDAARLRRGRHDDRHGPGYGLLFVGVSLFIRGWRELYCARQIFSLAIFPVIVIAYSLLARHEEKQMIERFEDEYRTYQRRVPMFFPQLGQWKLLFGSVQRTKDEIDKPRE